MSCDKVKQGKRKGEMKIRQSKTKLPKLPGGHNVVEVNSLNKRLDLATLVNLGLAHGANYFTGVSVNSSH